MTSTDRARTWLRVIVAAGVAVVALAFVPGWLSHTRILLGEGPRGVQTDLTAWQGQSFPVLSTGIALIGLAAVASAFILLRPHVLPPRAVIVLAAAGLGLLLASAWPIGQEGHASGVTLVPDLPLLVGILLAGVVIRGAVSVAAPSPRLVAVMAAVVLVTGVAGVAGRIVELNLTEGTGEHWSQGSYTRAAILGEPTETLTLEGTAYSIGGRWSGRFEASGLVLILTGDPACPSDRGSYHVDAATVGSPDLRWTAIVDLCSGGARRRDLEAGFWRRDR